jgi:hypothetical protein
MDGPHTGPSPPWSSTRDIRGSIAAGPPTAEVGARSSIRTAPHTITLPLLLAAPLGLMAGPSAPAAGLDISFTANGASLTDGPIGTTLPSGGQFYSGSLVLPAAEVTFEAIAVESAHLFLSGTFVVINTVATTTDVDIDLTHGVDDAAPGFIRRGSLVGLVPFGGTVSSQPGQLTLAPAVLASAASTAAWADRLPQTLAHFDGQTLDAAAELDIEGVVNGHLIRRFVDPDRGAITLTLPIDGPPPLRDGGHGVAAATLAGPYWITAICVLTNTSATTQLLGTSYMLPVSDPAVSLGGGASAGFLTPGFPPNGATYSSSSPAALSFMVDGVDVAYLFEEPFSFPTFVSPVIIGPDSWGAPIPSMPVPAPTADMGVDVASIVTSGDTVVFTFAYVVS